MFKDQLLMSWVFISCVAVSLAFGMILALLVEAPALNLEKILMQLLTGTNKTMSLQPEKREKDSTRIKGENGVNNIGFIDVENVK